MYLRSTIKAFTHTKAAQHNEYNEKISMQLKIDFPSFSFSAQQSAVILREPSRGDQAVRYKGEIT